MPFATNTYKKPHSTRMLGVRLVSPHSRWGRCNMPDQAYGCNIDQQ
jgi:hypothetical protein